MQKLMLAIGLTICVSVLMVPNLVTQEQVSIPHLFDLLQSENTTAVATAKFLELGPSNADAKNYLAKHLPAVINEEPKNYSVRVIPTASRTFRFGCPSTETSRGTGYKRLAYREDLILARARGRYSVSNVASARHTNGAELADYKHLLPSFT